MLRGQLGTNDSNRNLYYILSEPGLVGWPKDIQGQYRADLSVAVTSRTFPTVEHTAKAWKYNPEARSL